MGGDTAFRLSRARRATVATLAAVLAIGLAGLPPPADAQERWISNESEAMAVLPAPSGGTAVASASMVCAEQRWSFHLLLEEETEPPAGEIVLSVDGNSFAAEGMPTAAGLEISVPFEALEPLKRGLRLTLTFADGAADRFGAPVFSLTGSRAAMTAMEEVCSRPDMSAYRPITFTPYSSYMSLARRLRQDDIEQFRLATSSEPELTVAMAEFGDGRRMLFTKLCGSSWYFGRSGCNVTGFGPDAGENGWRIAYDTEGVLLHIDDSSDEFGWPDLVSLPLRAGGQASTWRWEGSRYRLLAN